MGQRSKITGLPAPMREALERKLVEGGFSGYVALQDWLRAQGFDIGKSSLHRYGSRLEEKIALYRLRGRLGVRAGPLCDVRRVRGRVHARGRL